MDADEPEIVDDHSSLQVKVGKHDRRRALRDAQQITIDAGGWGQYGALRSILSLDTNDTGEGSAIKGQGCVHVEVRSVGKQELHDASCAVLIVLEVVDRLGQVSVRSDFGGSPGRWR